MRNEKHDNEIEFHFETFASTSGRSGQSFSWIEFSMAIPEQANSATEVGRFGRVNMWDIMSLDSTTTEDV